MLVELLVVEPVREAHGVLALVGGRRAGAGGDRDRQGPLRGRRRRPLRRRRRRRRRRTRPGRSHEPGTAAGVRHLAREVPPHETDGYSGKDSPSDTSAKCANAEGVERRGEAALEDTSSQVEDGEADRDAVGVERPKECQTATDASNARRPERRGTSVGNTRYGETEIAECNL